MRIIAGAHKGARLTSPSGANTRPTSDRVKESLFSMLDGYGVVPAANVLDLFAGSGGLGFEAMSRGAAQVDFVDSSLAYQGEAGGLGLEAIRDLHRFGSEDFLPDRLKETLGDALGGLEHDVAHQAVGHNHVGHAREKLASLDKPDVVEPGR